VRKVVVKTRMRGTKKRCEKRLSESAKGKKKFLAQKETKKITRVKSPSVRNTRLFNSLEVFFGITIRKREITKLADFPTFFDQIFALIPPQSFHGGMEDGVFVIQRVLLI
jgi:hypothetical protein